MIIYGLKATGESLNGWNTSMYSRKLFKSQEAALTHKDDFLKKCCDKSQFECLDQHIRVIVIEHELDD